MHGHLIFERRILVSQRDDLSRRCPKLRFNPCMHRIVGRGGVALHCEGELEQHQPLALVGVLDEQLRGAKERGQKGSDNVGW